MNIESLIRYANKSIKRLDAEILACEVFSLSRTQLITQGNKNASIEQQTLFLNLVKKRSNDQSVSQILNKKNFYGYEFSVTNDVLTPRPETEILVESALEHIKKNKIKKIFDIGTGSGCIAISIAKNTINKEIIAVDISSQALKIAEKNLIKNRAENTQLRISDLFSNITKQEIEDACIITNLPYIPETDILENEVLNGDPHIALFSGKNGTDLYSRFFNEISDNFSCIFFEFDPPQHKYFEDLLTKLFPHRHIDFFKDYSGDTRFGSIT